MKNKTQNVGPGLEIDPDTKEIGCDLSPEALKNIFAILKDKAVLLKKVHESLFVGGIKTIFDLENPNLTNEEKQILKGKYQHKTEVVNLTSLLNGRSDGKSTSSGRMDFCS